MMQNRYVYKQCGFDVVVFLIYGQRNTHFGEKIFLDLTMQSFLMNSVHMAVTILKTGVGQLSVAHWP
jgi:hypothetical protein